MHAQTSTCCPRNKIVTVSSISCDFNQKYNCNSSSTIHNCEIELKKCVSEKSEQEENHIYYQHFEFNSPNLKKLVNRTNNKCNSLPLANLFNNTSSDTLVTMFSLANTAPNLTSKYLLQNDSKTNLNEFNIFKHELKKTTNNSSSFVKSDIYNISSPRIEASESNFLFFVDQSNLTSYKTSDNFLSENTHIFFSQHNQFTPLEDALKFVKTKHDSYGDHNRKLYSINFDPRFGISTEKSKIIAILNYEMKLLNNYIEAVLTDLNNDLKFLSSKIKIRDRFSYYFYKNKPYSVETKYYLLKKQSEIINKNPWCAFDVEFWKKFDI
ncbi:hypothetical protein QEN19_001796 [Hanseniaspora menglaensis]